jgi:hypothetical protein
MAEREKILKEMKKIEAYFQQYSSGKDLFHPELLCAKTTRKKIEKVTGHLTTRDVEDILKIYNETTTGSHYDGSGWLDYQIHLRQLLTIDSFNIDVVQVVG